MKRQGLVVTPRKLLNLTNELLKMEFVDLDTKCQINIINKSKASDSWEIEEDGGKNGNKENN